MQSNCGLNKLGPPSTAAFNAGVSFVIIGTPFSYIFYIRLTKSAKLQQIDQKNLSFVTICPPRFRRLSIPECIKNKYFPFNQNLNRIYFSINPFIYVLCKVFILRRIFWFHFWEKELVLSSCLWKEHPDIAGGLFEKIGKVKTDRESWTFLSGVINPSDFLREITPRFLHFQSLCVE